MSESRQEKISREIEEAKTDDAGVTSVNIKDRPAKCDSCEAPCGPSHLVIGVPKDGHIRFWWLCRQCYEIDVVE